MYTRFISRTLYSARTEIGSIEVKAKRTTDAVVHTNKRGKTMADNLPHREAVRQFAEATGLLEWHQDARRKRAGEFVRYSRP